MILAPSQEAIYAGIWKTIQGAPYPDPIGSVQTANLTGSITGTIPGDFYYQAGRTLGSHYYALALLWLTTHDPALVTEMMRVMAALRPQLAVYPTPPRVLDEVQAFNVIALHAYVMRLAGQAAESAYWSDVILKRIDSVWNLNWHGGAGAVALDNYAHTYAAALSTCWYLWLLTGQERFLIQANAQKAIFRAQVPNGALGWDMRMPIVYNALGSQDVGYARYTVQFLLFTALFNFEVIPLSEITAMILHILHDDGTLANATDGTETFHKNQWPLSLYGAFAKWDTTGKIAAFSAAHMQANTIFVPICQLFAG